MRLAAAIILIAACKEEPSPSRAGDGSSHLAPPQFTVESEITYRGDRPRMPPTCSSTVEHLKSAVMLYDAALYTLAQTKAPIVLAACIDDEWPMELKECIAGTPSDELIRDHECDKLVPDELAQKLLDRLAPGQHISPRDFLQR